MALGTKADLHQVVDEEADGLLGQAVVEQASDLLHRGASTPEDAPAEPTRPRLFPPPTYVPSTREECAQHLEDRWRMDAPNCISNWFPLLEAGGMKVPETRIFRFGPELYMDIVDACEGECPFPQAPLFQEILEAYRGFGEDAFLKLGNFSDKHSWEESCRLRPGLDADAIRGRVARLMYDQMLFGCDESLAVAVRRLIPTAPAFLARQFSNMPVTRERRLFTDGCCDVVCNHPYWPPEAFDDLSKEDAQALDALNRIRPEEEAYLAGEARKAAKLLAPLHSGGWSIDFLQDVEGGWWLIDVARASQSYHWPHEDGRRISNRG